MLAHWLFPVPTILDVMSELIDLSNVSRLVNLLHFLASLFPTSPQKSVADVTYSIKHKHHINQAISSRQHFTEYKMVYICGLL
ncbi:unnamed protein product [Peronospora belbahrii]|uniref:Uncharacterized protein n=1 Tax=Peronospora belbahrii TaxID=622444 RepID=A0ABN8D2B2_9STRA|nr:unnamed protein product [Peronospora belbahrii]